jgi:hypothetical protein
MSLAPRESPEGAGHFRNRETLKVFPADVHPERPDGAACCAASGVETFRVWLFPTL